MKNTTAFSLFFAWVFLCLLVFEINNTEAKKELKTQWTGGDVAVGVGDQYWKNTAWLEGVELGLREDGVLVYRVNKLTTR